MAIAPPSAAELSGFRTLRTVEDIAKFLGTTDLRLSHHLYSRSRPRYRRFNLPKASGGLRQIASPPRIISAFQRKLLTCMTAMVLPKEPAHGFTKDRSVLTNAKPHLGAAAVLNIDLENFFPSLHFGRV